jgi:cytochrome c nitrite reductase small subunit
MGKTSLVETMLFAAGAVTRLGKVDDGSTVTNFDADACAVVVNRLDYMCANSFRTLLAITALASTLSPVAAAATEIVIPRPRGWIGTVNEWMAGLGIAFALLGPVLLVFAWRSLRMGAVTPTARGWLLVAVGLVPIMVLFLSFSYGLEASSTVPGCGACHTMTPFVQDLQNVKSDSLAATHFKNGFIQENQCFTCHSDYGLGGTLTAKLQGLGHVWRYTTGSYTVPIKIAHPFSNLRCLRCHGESQKFLNSDGHPKEVIPDLVAGKASCLDCHGPAHAVQKTAVHR